MLIHVDMTLELYRSTGLGSTILTDPTNLPIIPRAGPCVLTEFVTMSVGHDELAKLST